MAVLQLRSGSQAQAPEQQAPAKQAVEQAGSAKQAEPEASRRSSSSATWSDDSQTSSSPAAAEAVTAPSTAQEAPSCSPASQAGSSAAAAAGAGAGALADTAAGAAPAGVQMPAEAAGSQPAAPPALPMRRSFSAQPVDHVTGRRSVQISAQRLGLASGGSSSGSVADAAGTMQRAESAVTALAEKLSRLPDPYSEASQPEPARADLYRWAAHAGGVLSRSACWDRLVQGPRQGGGRSQRQQGRTRQCAAIHAQSPPATAPGAHPRLSPRPPRVVQCVWPLAGARRRQHRQAAVVGHQPSCRAAARAVGG